MTPILEHLSHVDTGAVGGHSIGDDGGHGDDVEGISNIFCDDVHNP